jgi:transcriptional regulator with XRE-family HTH domain
MFWERFYNLCINAGTKPNTIREKIGVSSGTLTKWKKGECLPNGESLKCIADNLDCSVDYLLGRTDNPKAHLAPKDIEYESAVREIYESPKKLMKARLAAYKAARDEERRQAIQAYRESLFSEEWYKLAASESPGDEAMGIVKKALEESL